MKDPVFKEYIEVMERKKGKAGDPAHHEVRRWNSNSYPNLSFMSQFQQLRVVHPVAVNRTVVHTYNVRLKGAPEQMFRNTIAFANVVNGNGSLVLTDDLEIYNRIELGLSSQGTEWLQIGRGYQSDVPDAHGGRRGKNSTSEVYIRNMFDAWLGYMTNDRDPSRGPDTPKTQPMRASTDPPRLADALVRGLLIHEARPLDERGSDEWLALFSEECLPSRATDQASPRDTVSLMYDDRCC
jgi:hypothetical protein